MGSSFRFESSVVQVRLKMRLVLNAVALVTLVAIGYFGHVSETTPRYLLNLTDSELEEKVQRSGAANQFNGDLEQLPWLRPTDLSDAKSSVEPLCDTIKCDKNAYCSAPDVCECRLGYITIGTGCRSICGEAYAWSAVTDSCETRCKRPGVVWDGVTRSCVQRLVGQVEQIAAEVDILLPAIDDDLAEGGGDGGDNDSVGQSVDARRQVTSSDGAVGSCQPHDEECLNLAAEILTNSTDDSSETPTLLPIWMKVSSLLTALVSFGAVVHQLWRRLRQKQMEILEVSDTAAKIDFCDEYNLDRSQIMVY